MTPSEIVHLITNWDGPGTAGELRFCGAPGGLATAAHLHRTPGTYLDCGGQPLNVCPGCSEIDAARRAPAQEIAPRDPAESPAAA